MSGNERVIVAMSGGVDSSVAAAWLLRAGYDVVGVTLHLWDYPDDPSAKGGHGRCCAPEDQYDARRVADRLGFPHFTFDRRALFEETVVTPFVEAYLRGETPSPCTSCNRGVKLRELFTIADRLGATKVATGHYARLATHEGEPCLLTGRDPKKDQSYFLYATPKEELARLLFPLGEATKEEVRRAAVDLALPGATKGESQELCFVGQGQHAYAEFVGGRADGRVRPGPILDDEDQVVGHHDGVHRFTIGQRKGLGVALGEPRFVTAIDGSTGTVRVGSEAGLQGSSARLSDLVLAPGISLPFRARVKVRSRHEGAEGHVSRGEGSGALVRFDAPVRALTRGQIAVLYDGDRVLGGGRIEEVATKPLERARTSEVQA